jgi:hypothetical protein
MPPRDLFLFLRRHDPAVKALTLGLRDIVIAEIAPCHEYIYSMKWKVVLFYGATERVMDDGVCAIFVFRKSINLGFPRGVDLDDPRGALAGSGVGWRHISVKTAADLDRPEIPGFLRKARENAGPVRARRRGEPAVVTRVKMADG